MPRRYLRSTGLLSVLLAACILCTACNDTSASQSGASSSSQSTASSTSVSSRDTEPTDIPAEPTIEAEHTSDSNSTEEQPDTADIQPDTADVIGFPTEDIPAEVTTPAPTPETEEPPAVSSATTSPPVTATVTTTATTPATTLPPEPVVPVVIPDVMTVSSPGTATSANDKAVLDHSNASLGYISATYSGASARAKLRIVCGDVTYDHDLAVGGVTEYFPLSQGSGDYSVQIYEQIEGRSYSQVLSEPAEFTAAIPDDISMYLYPNKYVSFVQSSDCVEYSAEICAGADGTIEKLAAIFSYITDNITYDHELAATVKSGYIPYPDDVLKKGSGICFDYASLFAAMARAQGIPTRLVIGYATDIYHAWNEVYTEETGWISAELLLARKGYNLVDSTFYAGAEDKVAMAEYITNSSNYSAVYRY